MSTKQWESLFGTMAWSGPTFGSGLYTDGYAPPLRAPSPADQLQFLLEGWLRQDDLPVAAVGGDSTRIERMGMRPDIDYRQFPRLYIYSEIVNDEGITTAQITNINVYLEYVSAITSVTPASPGKATLASLVEYLSFWIKEREQMTVATALKPGGVALCEQAIVRSHDTVYALDEKERRFAFSQSLQITYNAIVDHATGRFWNLVHP